MIKKILVASDGSDVAKNAAEFAMDLASQTKSDIYGMYVADAIEYLAGMNLAEMYLPMHEKIIKKLEEEGRSIVKDLEEIAAKRGVNFTGKVIKGEKPVKEIIDAARKQGADLIVVGSHGKHASIIDVAMGEVPLKLLSADLPCPVTVVKPK